MFFTNDLIFGFIVFMGAVMVNRILAEKALKRLSTEQKAELLDSFSGHRIFHSIAMAILIVVYLIAFKVWPQSVVPIVCGVLILLVLMSIGNGVFSYLKLKKLSAPRDYVANFVIRSVVYYGALLLLIFTIGMKFVPR